MARINICAHIKNPKHWYCLDTHKILNSLSEMGSATLAAAVPYPGKATRILARNSEVLNMRDRERGKTDQKKPLRWDILCYHAFNVKAQKVQTEHFLLNGVSENQIFSFTGVFYTKTVKKPSSSHLVQLVPARQRAGA